MFAQISNRSHKYPRICARRFKIARAPLNGSVDTDRIGSDAAAAPLRAPNGH